MVPEVILCKDALCILHCLYKHCLFVVQSHASEHDRILDDTLLTALQTFNFLAIPIVINLVLLVYRWLLKFIKVPFHARWLHISGSQFDDSLLAELLKLFKIGR